MPHRFGLPELKLVEESDEEEKEAEEVPSDRRDANLGIDTLLMTLQGSWVPDGQMLSIIGGKITTYRKLAESALEYVEDAIGKRGTEWTAASKLPGGEFVETGYVAEVAALKSQFEFLEDQMARRLVRVYGLRAKVLLGNATSKADLGKDFGAGLSALEVRWLMDREFAQTAEDVVWRRSKLGLRMDDNQVAKLDKWMQAERAA